MLSRMSETTARALAYNKLREALRTGRYVPHQRLVEADVIVDLGVTKQALREAFARLEHEGLIERHAHRGAAVRLLTVDEAVEVLEIRAVVEGLAARHAALNATDDDITLLQETVQQLETSLAVPDISACVSAQARFHELVVDLCGRATLASLAEILSAQTAQTRLRTLLQGGRLRQSVEEHRAILDAIAAGDPAAAGTEMHRHLVNVMHAVSEGR